MEISKVSTASPHTVSVPELGPRSKARVDAYYERMEEISAAEEAREKLQELFDYSEEMREGAPLDDD